ncbi:hypothetical protein P3342_010682 [Pyrenophora teres f. teres]|uniref:Uncharacterized protein n=2 Tax=Pyrenophora teres f. teres TaxID=97479 RepID=E3RYE0_PYRTT|nr:hypothetical protein PTT_14553 [Pyrenophora teres f. teres 0-1]KAE8828996.1 hypothetical protein PTNB85_08184 [Pyrenophora teres f. teres]KAE8841502.1 hypothetical protein HRS9122_05628 [Pyrenophora teres f. teres]KAK1914693.1 hypothetical protein P3342_010682 [Pyrenophora teres f. teres]CAE7201579.1 hypothetical protein PTTW11_08875 [Pyrenophora teres f. teres]
MNKSRVVINPFVKNDHHMKRNTDNTRWVAAEPVTHRAGPSKNTDIVTPKLRHDSQEASMYEEADNFSPRTRVVTSTRDNTRSVSPVFPSYPSSTKKSETIAQSPWWNQDERTGPDTNTAVEKPDTRANAWYRTARHIYMTGPEGEGQKAWKLFQTVRSKQRIDTGRKQTAPVRRKVDETYNKALPRLPLSSHPRGVLYPPLRPRPIQARPEFEGKEPEPEPEPETRNARKDSEFSQTSYEVPITIDKNIHSTVDTSKPLPPAPHSSPAPKQQKTVAKTQVQSEVQPKVKVVNANPLGGSKQRTEKAGGHTWWKPFPSKAAPSLKTKISYPGPLMASGKGPAVNIAAESGGVGGPAAAVSLPVTRTGGFPPQAQTRYAAREEVDKAKVGRKRKSSDASFYCQGVEGALPDRYQVSERATSDKEPDMLPLPLFSGARDTRFYQPYVEVLDEY